MIGYIYIDVLLEALSGMDICLMSVLHQWYTWENGVIYLTVSNRIHIYMSI